MSRAWHIKVNMRIWKTALIAFSSAYEISNDVFRCFFLVEHGDLNAFEHLYLPARLHI